MVAIIFNIKKFDDVIDFNLWHVQMMGILVQTNLKKVATEKKPKNLISNRMGRV
ncbi:hypothetical protein Gotur_025833 [Gossypium turneri]